MKPNRGRESAPLWIVVVVVGSLLFSAGMSPYQSLLLSTSLVIGALGTAPLLKSMGFENSVVAGVVLFLCLVFPLVAFLSVLAGGMFAPISIALLGLAFLGVAILGSRVIAARDYSDTNWLILLGFVSVLSLVSKMWYFLIPAAAAIGAIVCAEAIRPRKWRFVARSFSLGLLILASTIVHAFSRHGWAEGSIFRTSDQFFRASLGIGVVSFGVDENMGASGTPVRYHWLSEAFINLMGRLALVSPTDAVVRISPVVGSLAAGAAMYWFVLVSGGRRSQGIFGAAMISILSVLLYSQGVNILKTTEMGQFWGTPMFLFGTVLVLRHLDSPHHLQTLILILWYPLLVMTNTTLGLAFACGTGIVLVAGMISDRKIRWSSLGTLLSFLVTLLILRTTLLESTSLEAFSPKFRLDDPFGFAYVFGYTGSIGIEKVATGIAFLVVLWFQGGASLGLRSKEPNQIWRTRIAVFVLGAITPAFFISIMDGWEQYRFLKPVLILGPASLALASDEILQVAKSVRGGTLLVCVGLGVLLGLQVEVLAKTFGDFEAIRPRVTYTALLIGVPLGTFVAFRFLGRHRKLVSLSNIRLVGLFGLFSVVVSATSLARLSPGQYDYVNFQIGPTIVNHERIECLHFVRRSTERGDVIASYMWRFGIDPSTEKWFLVSAMSERRTFVDGPIYVENPQSDALKLRQDITTRFVEIAPNYADRAVMLKAGVEYFIVDTRWTKRQTWEPYASRVFSNQDCIVLKLNKPSN